MTARCQAGTCPGLTTGTAGEFHTDVIRLSVLYAASLLCFFATRLEADLNKQFPLPGTFNLQQTIKVVGEKMPSKSSAQAVIKKERNGSITVTTKRQGPGGWFTIHREIFHPSGSYRIIYSKPRAVSSGRWTVKGKTLRFSFSGKDRLTIKAETTIASRNRYRTDLRYFARGKLLATSMIIGDRVR